MIALVAGLIHVVAAVSPAAPIVWIDEDFESPSYLDTNVFTEVWKVDGKHQDAMVSERESAGYGAYAFVEGKSGDSRHTRVFDPSNAVNGTDDRPLRLKYEFYINKNMATYRTCELVNTQSGDRVGIGPALGLRFWQVFDGVQWRDLEYSVPRAYGWNTLEIAIRTDALRITIFNRVGRSCETVPRLTRSCFGALAVGSGKANKDATTRIDNILLDGGSVSHKMGNHAPGTSSTPEDVFLMQRAAEALQGVHQGKPQSCLSALESLLQEAWDNASSGNHSSKVVVPWIYEAIASVQELLKAPPGIIRNVHYEAIAKAPDGLGADTAVRRLAAMLKDSEKANLLLNLSKRSSSSLAGLEAARMMVESRVEESRDDKIRRMQKLIEQASDTLVPEAVVETLLTQGTGEENERRTTEYVADALGDRSTRRAILAKYGECLSRQGHKLAQERNWESLQQLTNWVVAKHLDSCTPVFRKLLFESRMETGDIWGALAAISDRPLENEKAELLKDLAATDQLDRIHQLLNELISRAIERDYRIIPPSTGESLPSGREPVMWAAIAAAAEETALPRVAMVAYQALAREGKPTSAVDGSPLAAEFAVSQAEPEELAVFWKAQSLMAGKRLGEAGRTLESLAQSTSPVLRAQATYDLARVRQSQHRPVCATQPANVCESLLPTSQTVRKLRDSIAQDMGHQQESQRLHEQVGHAWAQVQQAKDSKEAATMLMSVAELEMQLGVPERAAEALEGLAAKYEDAPSLPACLDKLAVIYENVLDKKNESKAVRERLAKAFPGYVGTSQVAH